MSDPILVDDHGDDAQVAMTGAPVFNKLLLLLSDKIEELHNSVREEKVKFAVNGAEAKRSSSSTRFLDDLSSERALQELQKSVAENDATKHHFAGLTSALKMTARAEILQRALEVAGGEDDKIKLEREEIDHVKGLLAQQQELVCKILQVEDQRLEVQIKSRRTKAELFNQYASLEKLYPALQEDVADDGEGPDGQGVDKKAKLLQEEERKMREKFTLTQRLLIAMPSHLFDEETQKRHQDALLKYGDEEALFN